MPARVKHDASGIGGNKTARLFVNCEISTVVKYSTTSFRALPRSTMIVVSLNAGLSKPIPVGRRLQMRATVIYKRCGCEGLVVKCLFRMSENDAVFSFLDGIASNFLDILAPYGGKD